MLAHMWFNIRGANGEEIARGSRDATGTGQDPDRPCACLYRSILECDNVLLGYPFNRTGCRLRRWITLVLARTIRGPWASSRPGSAPMRTVLDYLEWL